ncbi:(Fe-S)-binding protein, partial [bacterium]|nr:(Fe-S)-binding protein [bacterium]
MKNPEGNGDKFNEDTFLKAQAKTKEFLRKLAGTILPGMSEDDVHKQLDKLSTWHPSKVRFGPNTTKSFREKSFPYRLKEEDIFFLDLGPVWS